MRLRSASPGRAALIGLLLAAIVTGNLVLMRTSSAGFTAITDNPANAWHAGSVTLTESRSGTAMYQLSDGAWNGGETRTRCVQVQYGGTITSGVEVRLHAALDAANKDLAQYLNLTVEAAPGTTANNCTGYPASPTTIYTGTLAGLATSHPNYAAATDTWQPAGTNEIRAYRFTFTLQNVNASKSLTATADLTWEAQSDNPPPAIAAGGGTVQITGQFLTAGGAPYQGMEVYALWDNSLSDAATASGADGRFSLTVPANTVLDDFGYYFANFDNARPGVPAYLDAATTNPFALTNDVNVTLTLPVIRALTVRVRESNGTPLTSGEVSTSHVAVPAPALWVGGPTLVSQQNPAGHAGFAVDSDGEVTLWAYNTTHTVMVSHSLNGSGHVEAESAPLTADQTVTITLP